MSGAPHSASISLEGQKSAAEPGANAWVAANAGSGKTKVLIDRVARLLLKGDAPDSILCVTYTKAAASEMQDRLFQRLGEWCVASPEALQADLVSWKGAATFGRGTRQGARAIRACAGDAGRPQDRDDPRVLRPHPPAVPAGGRHRAGLPRTR